VNKESNIKVHEITNSTDHKQNISNEDKGKQNIDNNGNQVAKSLEILKKLKNETKK
jgi:hypothetical protein